MPQFLSLHVFVSACLCLCLLFCLSVSISVSLSLSSLFVSVSPSSYQLSPWFRFSLPPPTVKHCHWEPQACIFLKSQGPRQREDECFSDYLVCHTSFPHSDCHQGHGHSAGHLRPSGIIGPAEYLGRVPTRSRRQCGVHRSQGHPHLTFVPHHPAPGLGTHDFSFLGCSATVCFCTHPCGAYPSRYASASHSRAYSRHSIANIYWNLLC